MLRLGRRSIPTIAGIALLCALAAVGVYQYAFADTRDEWVAVSVTDPIDYAVPVSGSPDRPVRIDSGYLGVSAVDSRTAMAVGWYSNTDDTPERPLWSRTTDGVIWSVPASMTAYTGRLRAVDAVSATDAWAVGDAGLVLHWNGSAWVRSAAGVTTAQLNGVAFTDALNGWAVGNAGTVLRTTDGGSTWTTPSVGLSGNLYAVSAAGPGCVVAVGVGGSCVRWNGTSWSLANAGTSLSLLGVDVLDGTHAWAVGSYDVTGAAATVFRWEGSGWVRPTSFELQSGHSNNVRAVTFADANYGVAVGDFGMVWRTIDGGANWWVYEVPTQVSGTPDVDRAGADAAPDDPTRVWVTGDAPSEGTSGGRRIARVYQGTLNYMAPDAPFAFEVTATAPGPRASVAWTNVALGAVDFIVQRAKDTTATWVTLGAPITATVGPMTFTDTFSGVPAADAWGATWYYRVQARGRLGASDWVVAPALRLDGSPPTTVASPTLDGWFTTPQTVTFPATDTPTGSGVSRTWHRVVGSAATTAASYTAVEGETALEWWSVDVAGNIETTRSGTVRIDMTAPETTPTAVVDPMYWGPVSISLQASDSLSHVARTVWSLDGGSETSGTTVPIVSDVGTYTLTFRSFDVAGNAETTRTRVFRVTPSDSLPPTNVTRAWAGPDPKVLVAWTDASDNESGFRIERAQNTTDTWVPVAAPGVDVQSWTDELSAFDADAKWDSTWYYRVRSLTPKTVADVWVYSEGIVLAQAPPDTRAFVNGVEVARGGESVWLRSAEVTFSVVPAGSTTVYRLDGVAESTTYTVPVAITAGVRVIAYRSSCVGHKDEDTRTITVRIDTTAPVTTANVGLLVSQPLLRLTPTDVQSRVGTTWYGFDGAAEAIYDALSPPAVPRGVHSVRWWSVDGAGNVEGWQSGTIIGGPQASVSTPKGSSSTRVRRTLTFSGKMTRATNHRRLTLLAYRFDGADWILTRTKSVQVHTPRRGLTTYRGAIKFTAKGSWKVVARYEGDAYWVQSYSAPKYVIVR
jgi:photosystem II stability/assembly factor-like uncharacterized protein